ncbi:MAG: hypothetical protein R6U32_06520 [Candidatus Woesearchaeota archaeon]
MATAGKDSKGKRSGGGRVPEKSIVFDAGPVISLAMNSLLWILEPMKERFGGRFYISPVVKREIVERPLKTKRFRFEAMRVLSHIKRGVIEVADQRGIKGRTRMLMGLANKSFMAKGSWVQLVHKGEIEALAAATMIGSEAIAVDERTLRMMIEDPARLKDIMEHKLHTKIKVDRKNLERFREETEGIRVIRSTELAAMAYEMGLLDRYLPDMPRPGRKLLESVLWGIKLKGCSITRREIETITKVETKTK